MRSWGQAQKAWDNYLKLPVDTRSWRHTAVMYAYGADGKWGGQQPHGLAPATRSCTGTLQCHQACTRWRYELPSKGLKPIVAVYVLQVPGCGRCTSQAWVSAYIACINPSTIAYGPTVPTGVGSTGRLCRRPCTRVSTSLLPSAAGPLLMRSVSVAWGQQGRRGADEVRSEGPVSGTVREAGHFRHVWERKAVPFFVGQRWPGTVRQAVQQVRWTYATR